MTEKEIQEFLKSDKGVDIRRYLDKRVNDAVQSYQANHNTQGTADRVAELEKDNEAKDVKIESLEIDRHLFETAIKHNIDYELLIGYPYRDLEDVDRRVELFADKLGNRDTRRNNEILASGFKPGSGNTSHDKPKSNELSFDRLLLADQTGDLDRMIENEN